MGKEGVRDIICQKIREGRKTDWAEFTGLCVADEIMVDLIMDPHYHNVPIS
jgi:hypothetical protein